MRRVLITRPRDEAETLAIQLKAMGFEPIIEQMLAIRSIVGASIDWSGAQAIAFTSANGVRADAVLNVPRDIKVFTVGKATGAAARAAGFRAVIEGDGTVEELASLVATRCSPSNGKLIHVSGSVVARDFAALLAPSGIVVERAVVYESAQADSLSPQGRDKLVSGAVDLALFFSPRTARTFVSLVAGAGLQDKTKSIVAVALSEAVARALSPLAFARVEVAKRPTTEAVLEQLAALKS
jgi:uroporphyrinogen-III synthase